MKRSTLNKNKLISAALLCSALTLASCSDSADEVNPPTPSVEPAAGDDKSKSPDVPRSPRGNIIKEVGEPARILTAENNDEWAVNFTVTDIEIDPVCTREYASAPENGHMVALTVEAATASEPTFSESGMTGISFHPFHWKAIAPNGTTVNTVYSVGADNCFTEAEMLPDLGAGEKAIGKVVLDVPDVSGTLIYSWGAGTGWEWEYGVK